FGISATSWIFPKTLRPRLRPVNVCAISSLSLSRCRTVGPGTTLRKAAIHRDHQDNRREPLLLCESAGRRSANSPPPSGRDMDDSGVWAPRHQLHPIHAYLSSTLAPAFSNCAFTFSASSLVTPSLTGLGAPSTRSFASLRPKPVSARTSLITSIFFSPTAVSTTLNSVCSSTGAAAPPPGAAATATAAAAETPHFSS